MVYFQFCLEKGLNCSVMKNPNLASNRTTFLQDWRLGACKEEDV
jgi:hypothetical protein